MVPQRGTPSQVTLTVSERTPGLRFHCQIPVEEEPVAKFSKKSILGGPVAMAYSANKNKSAESEANQPDPPEAVVEPETDETDANTEAVARKANAARRKGTSEKKMGKLLEDLLPILRDGEEVLDCTHGTATVQRMGQKSLRRGTLFVSNQRAGVFTKKLGGYDLTDFAYGLITAVQHKEGMMNGEIDILASGTRLEVHQIPKGEATKLANLIRHQMAHHHAPSAPSVPVAAPIDGPHEELKKLADLHQSGLLTDEEFAAKRQVIVDKL
jgi:hypothetical protein